MLVGHVGTFQRYTTLSPEAEAEIAVN
jgi:hypothetical protein